jgi:hypothetical protein
MEQLVVIAWTTGTAGVQTGAGQLGRGLAEGPRQIQAILARLQARMEEQRLQASLQAERDSPVDVQVSPTLKHGTSLVR